MCMRELSNFKQKIWVKSDLIIHFSTFDCNVISMEACLQHSFVLAGLAACQPLRINKALYESEPSMYIQSMSTPGTCCLACSTPGNSKSLVCTVSPTCAVCVSRLESHGISHINLHDYFPIFY